MIIYSRPISSQVECQRRDTEKEPTRVARCVLTSDSLKACHVTRKPNAEQYFVMPVEKCYGNARLQPPTSALKNRIEVGHF